MNTQEWNEELEDELGEGQPEGSETEERVIRLQIIVDANQEPLRIDKFVMNRLEGATRNKIQNNVDDGLILVNGKQIKTNHKVKGGDEVIVYEHRDRKSVV